MSIQNRRKLLIVLSLACVALVLVAAALSSLTMLPAQTAPILRETKTAPAVLDLGWLIGVTLALYVLGFIFLTPASLRRRLAYAAVALAGIAALIVLLVWLAGETALGVPPMPAAAPLTPTAELLETFVPETEEPVIETTPFAPPPRWVGTIITAGAGLLLIVGALVFLWRRQVRMSETRLPPLMQLAQEARLAIDALRGGENVREVILRCYFEMVHVLDETRGIRRMEMVTPREFAAQLVALGLPAGPVTTLTELFEEARYGMGSADTGASDRAIASLTAIIAACEGPS
ncbi:MAG: hypothetical protein BWY63_03720 [Chloroflexi bacterium ADurb.Bin360]|nr:MAG: hypothetical protein BWY63_03720 [Chloroflexi bacterium ADurb.Bin360]